MKKYKFDFESIPCCDSCNDKIGADFDCPECKKTAIEIEAKLKSNFYHSGYGYYNLWEELPDAKIGLIIKCSNCDAKFKLIDNSSDVYNDYVWEKISSTLDE